MEDIQEILEFLTGEIEKKEKSEPLSFEDYLALARKDPEKIFRNIFQLFYDAVIYYVGEGKSEYPPDDPANAPLIEYDCSKLFEEGVENPYFIDRLFGNRFVQEIKSLITGAQQNRILAFIGSHGCGKSTFLNNLFQKLQEYINGKGAFEIFWEIDPTQFSQEEEKFEIPCPSHDCPILIIPRDSRAEFLKRLLPESEIKDKIFSQKEYEWIFKQEVCTICDSLFWALHEKLGSIDKALSMLKVRPYKFNRRLGEGLVVFSPGDVTPLPPKASYLTHQKIQENLDRVFGPNRVRYVYSLLAKTNNGIYALMDIKSRNTERFKDLHNVVSEGTWKAGEIEEKINSLIVALMNPEDRVALEKDETNESLQGRIRYVNISYILEPGVEVKVYQSIWGKEINSYFLPRVLENFARVIISSRMKADCQPFQKWIPKMREYEKYCDSSGLLLRMELYSGKFPPWLSDEDKRKLTLPLKREIILFGTQEGIEGITGRDSIQLFDNFRRLYQSNSKLITMDNVAEYFKNKIDPEQRDKYIPRNFIGSLINWYDYGVLNEVKEALYFYNEVQISEDVLHFIWAVNCAPGDKVSCRWTKKEFKVTMEFLKEMAARITGTTYGDYGDAAVKIYVQEIQQKYTLIVAQGEEKEITKTELYQELFNSYVKNLKDKALELYQDNRNFREAVKAYGTKKFEAFDSRLKVSVTYMIENLIEKFGYTERGAKEICLYVLDKDLARKFS